MYWVVLQDYMTLEFVAEAVDGPLSEDEEADWGECVGLYLVGIYDRPTAQEAIAQAESDLEDGTVSCPYA